MLSLPAILALLASPLAGDLHTDTHRGFQIEVPQGWTVEEKLGGSEVAFTLTLRPPEASPGIGVEVQRSRPTRAALPRGSCAAATSSGCGAESGTRASRSTRSRSRASPRPP